jgi:hypothetical protein
LELARLLQLLKEYTQSAEVLAGCAAAPGIQHSGIEFIRLRNQYHLYQDSAELRAGLRTWRQQRGIYPEFCNWEVHLAHLLLDWERILEVTDQVKDKVTATSGVYSTYLFALYRLGRSAELQVALEEVVEQPSLLTGEQLLQAAGLAMQEGHVEIALQLAYPLASHREDVQARSRYLALMTHCPAGRPQPIEVGLGSSVRYRVNGRQQARLTITEQSLASGSNPLVQKLLGRQVGESFTHLHPLNRRSLHVEVVSITDCYTGLFQEITEEIGQHEAAMPFQSVNFGSDTPTLAEMNQTFRELLGEEQKQTQARVDQARAAYAAGDTTFIQLAASLHSGSGLETYHWLTSGRDDSPGLQVLPGWFYPPIADLQQQPIMLDWTSLPPLFTLARQYELPLPASLWVSHHLLEELREQVREKRRSKPVEISIEVVDGEVRPHFYPPEMHARQLTYLTDLLAWVEANCQTRLVGEKLDVLRQLKDKTVGSLLEQPLATVVDTAFLVGHTPAGVVVTDDATLLQISLSMGGRALSVEAFLKVCYPAQYLPTLLPELLDRHYIGVQVEAPTLLREFVQAGHEFSGRAQRALRNAVQQVQYHPDRWRTLAHFARELYLLPGLSAARKLEAGSFALALGLYHMDQTEATLTKVATHFAEACCLLPAYHQELAEMLHIAWERAARYQRVGSKERK